MPQGEKCQLKIASTPLKKHNLATLAKQLNQQDDSGYLYVFIGQTRQAVGLMHQAGNKASGIHIITIIIEQLPVRTKQACQQCIVLTGDPAHMLTLISLQKLTGLRIHAPRYNCTEASRQQH